jgi:hypothetical protein
MTIHCTTAGRFDFRAIPDPSGGRNWGCGTCHVWIYQDDEPGFQPVMVASELADNPGPSALLAVQHIVSQAWATLLPALETAPTVVKHVPCDHPDRQHSGDADFRLVGFRHVNPSWRRVLFPTFQALDYLGLAALVGPPAAAELIVWRCRS